MEKEEEANHTKTEDEELEGEEKFWTFFRILHLSILMAGSFLNWVAYDVLSTFYPMEAEAHGASNTIIGLVFGMFPLVSFAASFVYGTWMFAIGPYRLMVAGMVLNGAMLTLFAFVTMLPNGGAFIAASLVLRLFSAIGGSACGNAVLSITIEAYKPYIGTVVGINEMVLALGIGSGPVIGGSLYQVGGFKLPFFVVGGSLLVGAPIYLYAISKKVNVLDKPKESKGSMLQPFRIPAIVMMVFASSFGFIITGFLTANLGKHLSKFGLKSTYIGLLFGMKSTVYAIMCPTFGYITDRTGGSRFVMVGSLVLAGLSTQLLGPTPLLPFLPQGKVWLVAISLILFPIALSAIYTTLLPDMVKTARMEGMPDDPSTDGVLSAVFLATLNIGLFAGSFIGGMLIDSFGFRMSSSIIGIAVLFEALALTIFIIWDRLRQRRLGSSEYKQLKSTEPEE